MISGCCHSAGVDELSFSSPIFACVSSATQMSPSGISRGGIGFVSNSIASNNTSTDMLAGGGGGICGARSNGVMASTGGNTAAPAASPNATCASSSEDSFPTKLPRNQQRLSSLIQQGGLITPSKRPSSGNSSHRGSGSSSSSSTGSGASPSVITHQTPASASVGSGGVSPYRASPHLSSQTSSTGGAGKGGGGGSASSSSSSVQAVVGGGGGGGGGQQHPQRGGQQIIGGGTDRGGPHGQRGSKSTSSMSGGQHAVAAGAVSQGTSGHVVSGSMMTHKGQETKGGGGVAGGGRPLGISGQQQHLQTTPQSATQGAMAEAGSRLPVSGQRRGSGLAVGGQLSSSSPSSSTAQPHHLHGAMLSHDTQQHAQQANMIGGGGGAGSQGGPYAAKPQQQGQQHLVGAKTQQLGGPEQISSSLSSSSSSPGAGRQGLMVMSSTQAGAFSTNQTAQKQRQPQARTAAAPGTQSSPGQYQQHPMQRSSSSHQLQSADLVSSSSQNIKDLQKRGSADPHQPQQQQFLVGTERGVPAKAFRQQPQQQPQQQAVGASPMLAQQPSVGVAGAGVYAPEHGKAGLAGQAGIPLSSATSNTQSLAMLNHTSQQPMQHPPQHRDFSLPTGGVGGSQLPAYQQNSHRSMDIQGQRNSGGAGENFKRRQSMMEASHVAGGGIGGAGTTQGHDEMVLRPQLAGRSASMTNVEGGGGWTAATGVEGSQAGAVASQPVITAQQGGGLQTAVQVGGGGGQQMPVRAQQWGGGGQPQAGPPPLSSVQPAPETLVGMRESTPQSFSEAGVAFLPDTGAPVLVPVTRTRSVSFAYIHVGRVREGVGFLSSRVHSRARSRCVASEAHHVYASDKAQAFHIYVEKYLKGTCVQLTSFVLFSCMPVRLYGRTCKSHEYHSPTRYISPYANVFGSAYTTPYASIHVVFCPRLHACSVYRLYVFRRHESRY